MRAHNAVGFSGWSGPSSAAEPDDEINLVGRIRLVEAGDGFLRIAWRPPKTKGGAQVTYAVRWPGGQLNGVTEPSATIGDLDNHQKYVITVKPVNVFAPGGGLISEPFQPVGTPLTPPPPTLTDQETAGSSGAVSLTWPVVDANGPTPVRYTVFRDNQPVQACTEIFARVCDLSNLTYDGSVYDFSLLATNAGDKSSVRGPATQWRATGKPASWGTWSVLPTGDNNRARASFTVPASRGAESIARVYVDGAKVYQTTSLGSQDATFDVPNNLGPHAVSLEVCNEKGRLHPVVGPERADLRTARARAHPQHHADHQRAQRLVDHRGRQQRRPGDPDSHQRRGSLAAASRCRSASPPSPPTPWSSATRRPRP